MTSVQTFLSRLSGGLRNVCFGHQDYNHDILIKLSVYATNRIGWFGAKNVRSSRAQHFHNKNVQISRNISHNLRECLILCNYQLFCLYIIYYSIMEKLCRCMQLIPPSPPQFPKHTNHFWKTMNEPIQKLYLPLK